MTYILKPIDEHGSIMVVGCGGTGGYVAERICRLVMGQERSIILIDPDLVEPKNVGRQNFYREDVGKFKAQALAERLARQFDREINYITRRIEDINYNCRGALTIGCVDNAAARERLEVAYYNFYGMHHNTYSYHAIGGWYIDAGNGEHSGQVLIGNAFLRECQHGFDAIAGLCEKLPLPTVQQPALLVPESRPRVRREDCAARVARQEQSPVINAMMADTVAVFADKLLEGKLQWQGAYLDLERGSVKFVDADPEAVARLTGIKVNSLYSARTVTREEFVAGVEA
jgi:PRTRC genetic system ThiF family protein